MSGKPQHLNHKQVMSWAKYLVEIGICKRNDFSVAVIHGVKYGDQMQRAVQRNSAAMHASALAAKHPEQYTAWCVRERVAGRMK